MHSVRYDARHDTRMGLRGKTLRPQRRLKDGRFFYSRARDCVGCPLAGGYLFQGHVNMTVAIGDSNQRHRWRSEGLCGEAARNKPAVVAAA